MDRQELKHDCRCASIDVTTAFLAVSDELVAKALVISEVAQIARSEMRARQLLTNLWRVRADQSAKAAQKVVAGGGKLSVALTAVDAVMAKFPVDAKRGFTKEMETSYRLARVAGWKKATGQTTASLSYMLASFEDQIASGKEKVRKAAKKPRATILPHFGLVDRRAIAALQVDQMIWVGNFYNKQLRTAIRETIKPALLEGLGRRDAGMKLREMLESSFRQISVPNGFRGTDAQYFEGLAANTITTARVRGQIASFSELDVQLFEINNPDDERTSEICQHMLGKQFEVSTAVDQIAKVSGATNPDQVRAAAPWLSYSKLLEISPKAHQVSDSDMKKLVAAGFVLPPYHFRCRSTVDIVL